LGALEWAWPGGIFIQELNLNMFYKYFHDGKEVVFFLVQEYKIGPVILINFLYLESNAKFSNNNLFQEMKPAW